MWESIVKALFIVGFLATWLGFVVLILPMNVRFLRGPWAKTLFDTYAEKLRQSGEFMAHEFQTSGTTRFGRWGQMLVAVGSSLLIASGALWLVLRIVEKQQ